MSDPVTLVLTYVEAAQRARTSGAQDDFEAIRGYLADEVEIKLASPWTRVPWRTAHTGADALVDRLRDDVVPLAIGGTRLKVHVGGMVPANLDTTRGSAERLPLFFGGVLLMSFVLLMMVFRSVVVPLKAVAMNLLASAAAFGVLTVAVSGGALGDLVGIPEAIPVPIQLPIGQPTSNPP